ncbi:MAG: cadherin-like domain-containing protein, partial [Verrucomicrobiae bacterium]|nr:cadherin-like domain-containing protein [Verrucomicrobiae bacterium]
MMGLQDHSSPVLENPGAARQGRRRTRPWTWFPWILVAWCFAITRGVNAASYTNVSSWLALGPGETAFRVVLPQFNLPAGSKPLTQVQISLEAVLDGTVEFFGDTVARQVVYRAGDFTLAATPRISGVLGPQPLSLLLEGETLVGANASLSIAGRAQGTETALTGDTQAMGRFLGTGTLEFDLDSIASGGTAVDTTATRGRALLCGLRTTFRLVATGLDGVAPVARDDVLGLVAGRSASIAPAMVLANDTDADPAKLTVSGVSSSSDRGGRVSLVGGRIVYRAPSGYAGSDAFSYQIRNAAGLMASA